MDLGLVRLGRWWEANERRVVCALRLRLQLQSTPSLLALALMLSDCVFRCHRVFANVRLSVHRGQ